MSQKFLYGPSYVSKNGPLEWDTVGVDSTTNDGLVDAAINTNEFTFVGKAAEYLKAWRNAPGKGIGNGVPFRIVVSSNKNSSLSAVVFDGYIDLSKGTLQSQFNPIRYVAPVVELERSDRIIEKMAVLTQGVLAQKNAINYTDFVDVPVIRESKKNVAERTMILTNFGSKCVIGLLQIGNNMLSAISDVVGLSVLIGIVEILLTFVNAVIVIKRLFQEGKQLVDLFFPLIYYYRGFNIAHMIRKAFEYKGYNVNYGILDDFLANVYLLASQNEENGWPFPGLPAMGMNKPNDFGYAIGELIEGLGKMTNMRHEVRDGVAHLRNRLDPFWSASPAYTPEPVLIKTVAQYSNGSHRDDTDRLKSTVIINYQYDESDCHTLTEKSGDTHEVHRDLITELNVKMNTLEGIQEVEIPWAMCVRKKPFDNLWELFTGISAEFDGFVGEVVALIQQFNAELNASGVNISSQVNDILNQTPLGQVLQSRAGALKIDDNAYAIPKVLYMTQTDNGLRIPEDFKDYIGAKALYQNWYFGESPADINNWAGQWRIIEQLQMRWSFEKYVQTKTNPFFVLNGNSAKFTFVNWLEAKHRAVVNVEVQEIFDKNITEEEI